MFYKQQKELTRAEMEMARRGFRGKLMRLRFSPQFIVNHSDDLLAIAHTEYVRALGKGVDVEDPVAWTIHCAWRRTQNLLQAESQRPRMISSEKLPELIDSGAAAPEELAIEEDRARRVREAVAKLSEEQRKVIALTFFEGLSVRQAAGHLDWSAGKVQHHRDSALRQLRRFMPVRTSDELAVEVGMIAWLSLAGSASGFQLPGGFESVLERPSHGASGMWAKAQELARRFTLGGGSDAASAAATSGAGRAAGVCATGVAIVCLAGASTGLVGPGIGGTGASGDHSASTAAKRTNTSTISAPSQTTIEPTSTTPVATSAPTSAAHTRELGSATPASEKASARRKEQRQVEAQTSGMARAAAESPASSTPSASSSGASSAEPVTVVSTGSAGSGSSGTSAASEFGFEK